MNYFENKTVVVPIDFSDHSMEAVDTALEMTDDSNTVHLIYVIQMASTLVSFDPSMPVPPVDDQELHNRAVARMEKLFGSGKYARFERHCRIGDPGTEIVEFAKTVEADLIVMSSHGRTGLKRLLMGSVAERVLRHANCAVLILRGKD